FFFSSRRRHTRLQGDWSSDVCSSDLLCLTLSPQLIHAATLEDVIARLDALERNNAKLARENAQLRDQVKHVAAVRPAAPVEVSQIGRASCRERGWSAEVAEALEGKRR